ncbi:metalloregulator ArsR/SmtB family transcription factor [Candidatus Parcubacteria bacterium]|nr:metalloregulator ArsR/SmtB family transcription factor [Candidatus Parcubacteria bacterium]
MNHKKLGTTAKTGKTKAEPGRTYRRPAWVPKTVAGEEELCPDCFKVVGERSRYAMVCMLGKAKGGLTVGEITEKTKLRQPTVTHHLQILHSVKAVEMEPRGRERVYRLRRDAHCFEECKIPY